MGTGCNMIVTKFLPIDQFDQYGDWLRGQDIETCELYFGVAGSDHVIDNLMDRIHTNSADHWILVAQDQDLWIGTLHIAINGTTVEFGLIVRPDRRGEGIASRMLEEALIWVRNRGYQELFMHCLGWNKPIRHLCHKHGLEPKNVYGDSEVEMKLPPANWVTINKEICINQRNWYHKFLQNNWALYQQVYS